jgi:hypothetical protein
MLAMIEQFDLPAACRPGLVRLPVATKDLGELAAWPDGEHILAQRLAAAALARQRHLERSAHDTARQDVHPRTPIGLS